MVENVLYDFYYGNVFIVVSGDFKAVSVYCYNHGTMGLKDLFVFNKSCPSSSSSSSALISNLPNVFLIGMLKFLSYLIVALQLIEVFQVLINKQVRPL